MPSKSKHRSRVDEIHAQLRDTIDEARAGLLPSQDKELLEELGADITGWLDCLREEDEES